MLIGLKRFLGFKIFVVISLFTTLSAFSQQGKLSITGTITDEENKPLRGATVTVLPLTDTTNKSGDVTNKDGNFKVENLRRGEYHIDISFIGFTKMRKTLSLTPENGNLGKISLKSGDVRLGDVNVSATMVRQEQKDDTTIFNANAFKVNPDATTEDLVRKMPGVTVGADGTVQAQGENVRRVLVDGKEFFGEDPTMALRTLPAEIIDKIQVYDRASDQAQFTGFDDGNAQKTLNIITKSDKNTGNFGKLYAGYGTEDRFWAGGNINYFNGDTKLSVIGLSNNINQQNFAVQDVLSATGAQAGRRGGGMRSMGGGSFRGMGGSGDFMVGQQNGISTTNSIGFNYSDVWNDDITFTGSYFLNMSDNDNSSILSRNYFTQDEENQIYNEDNLSETENYNHRINGRLEYKIDSSNSLILRPRLNIQANSLVSGVDGSTIINNSPLNSTTNDYTSDLNALNFENSLLYRLKFPTKGRTLSMELETTINNNSGNTLLNSQNTIFDTLNSVIELKQDGDIFGNGYRIETDIEYTEPISENGILQFSYEPTYTVSSSDKEIFNLSETELPNRLLDSSFSNNYENIYFRQRGGLSYQYRTEKSNFSAGIEYQTAQLEGKQIFPFSNNTSYTFNNILPHIRYIYNFSKTTNFRLFYRTSTDAPSVSQLQDVVDNSNPVQLRVGNPNLKQNFTHTLVSRIGSADPHAASSIFAFAMLRFTEDYISNSTITTRRDTTINSVPMYAGSQLTRPVNLDGYMMARTFLTYGIPVTFLKSNFNINAGLNYTRTPGLIENIKNESNNYSISSGAVLSSNISQDLDFTLAYNGNYSIVKNSILPDRNNNYYISVANIKFNWIVWGGLVLNSEVFHNLYTGLDQDFNQEFLLWNASIGYKFLNNNAGEVRLSVYDILGQNNSISRNVNEIYLEDLRTQVLQRYFMLTFTYNLRSFGG